MMAGFNIVTNFRLGEGALGERKLIQKIEFFILSFCRLSEVFDFM
jgi:hypothetical protein